MNGQNGAKAETPAASQATPAEAEDDSDDDQEEGEGAVDAGASGGEWFFFFASFPSVLYLGPTPHLDTPK